jgi:CelD/BcsL family acetyltransferase involved in cellulose biosynthesis
MSAMPQKERRSAVYMDGDTTTVEIIDTAREFSLLEAEWCDLFKHCAHATPFQSWAWLYSWWEYYGSEGALRLLVVRQGGLMIGLVPLMLEPRLAFPRLVFIGTGVTDRLDILVRDGHHDSFIRCAIAALDSLQRWLIVDLHQVRPQAAVWELVRAWRRPQLNVWEDDEPVISVRKPDQILSNLSQNHRSTLRRALRRAETSRIERSLASEAEAENAGRRLVDLHREMWEGRSIAPEHTTVRFQLLFAAAARRLTAAGLGAVSQFCCNGRVLVASLLVFDRDQVGTYLQGADRDAAAQFQISSLYIWDALNVAGDRGASTVSLLRGSEPYKLRWRPEIKATHRIVVGRNWLVWVPYAILVSLHSRAKRYVHSGEAPSWFLTMAKIYRFFARVCRCVKAGAAAPPNRPESF